LTIINIDSIVVVLFLLLGNWELSV